MTSRHLGLLLASSLAVSSLAGYLPYSDAYASPLTRFAVFAASVMAVWLISPVGSVSERYRRLAIVGFTGAFSLLAANFGGAALEIGRDAVEELSRERADTGLEDGPLRAIAYPDLTDEAVETLRDNLSRIQYDYAPFVQFTRCPWTRGS